MSNYKFLTEQNRSYISNYEKPFKIIHNNGING